MFDSLPSPPPPFENLLPCSCCMKFCCISGCNLNVMKAISVLYVFIFPPYLKYPFSPPLLLSLLPFLYFFAYMCITCMYVCVCLWVWVCMCHSARVRGHRTTLGVGPHLLLFWDRVSLFAADMQASYLFFPSHLRSTGITDVWYCAWLYVGSMSVNSSPHPGIVSACFLFVCF